VELRSRHSTRQELPPQSFALKRAKPIDLPIEFPRNLALTVNLKTAKTLGLKIPPILLASADQVIEQ
jgi:ABC-type uncharacterized transport system substrate-binding protein